jgi:hypothetical protein
MGFSKLYSAEIVPNNGRTYNCKDIEEEKIVNGID